MTHAELVKLGRKWLRKARNCQVILSETQAKSGEIPDVIGWRGQFSYLIECKTSLSDFRRDLQKWFRQDGLGIGQHRFFMAPAGVIPTSELPCGWGLLEVTGDVVKTVVDQSLSYYNERRAAAELPLLVAVLRRVQLQISSKKKQRGPHKDRKRRHQK